MRFMRLLLLLIAFAMLNIAKAAELDHTSSDCGGRQLRTITTNDKEQRSLSIPSAIESGITRWRIKIWMRNKMPDHSVLEKLSLAGVTEKTLTRDPKFKIFQKVKVESWLKEKASTTKVWEKLGLHRLPITDVEKADEFSTFVKYVAALNEKAKNIQFKKWPKPFEGGSPEEMAAKSYILKKLKRNDIDRRIMLGVFM
ncbi:hypothetical protein GN244_ATG09260 [Phytophthora infestans]|uniref:Secreted RxLR effector peptide protein n=1 Tax=Phytophthora infestans TaxID=4787 RepID=A0A833WDS0_PHYIN|nr:hypothetical protein GN244_ATG09260 [Phytophthora infestans]KAF4142196.1 hypothetical protein GN958_ATG08618 [Phytophthora infestans]